MNKKKRNFVIATLRKASFKWPTRYAAIKKARISRGIYECKKCKKTGPLKEFDLDHVIPVIGPEGFISFDVYIERLFPDNEDGWQLLCKKCHEKKTEKENKIRRKNKK